MQREEAEQPRPGPPLSLPVPVPARRWCSSRHDTQRCQLLREGGREDPGRGEEKPGPSISHRPDTSRCTRSRCSGLVAAALRWQRALGSGSASPPQRTNPAAFRAAEQMEILGCVRTGPRTREMAQKCPRGRGTVLKGRTQLGFTALIRLLRGSHGRETPGRALRILLPPLLPPLGTAPPGAPRGERK